MSRQASELRKSLDDRTPRKKPIPDGDRLSLGNTILNLAVSGHADWGFGKGQYLWVVGDSSSGKTWLAFQILAEAARNPNFKGHRFIYDNAENGALFDVAEYFGAEVERRMEPPRGTCKKPRFSTTVEELYYWLYDATHDAKDRPFIYVIDSMDALDSESDEEKFLEHKAAFESGKDAKGSFAISKAKVNSMNIKRVISRLPRNGSMLIVLNQTRDKIGSAVPMKTSAGGRALKFYAHAELWSSVRGDVSNSVLGKERVRGAYVQFDVKKNRISGRDIKVTVPFLWKHGFDETGACVDFLIEEKRWKKNKDTFAVSVGPDFPKQSSSREQLIQYIEESEDREKKLRAITQFRWKEIAEATRVKRKKRY